MVNTLRKGIVVVVLAAGVVCSGCRQGEMTVSTRAVSKASGRLDYHDYGRVLTRCVDKGLIKFRSLQKCSGLLDGFIASLADGGPRSTPAYFCQPNQELAFWINVHNAVALQAAVRDFYYCREPGKTNKLPGRTFPDRVWVRVDGRDLTLSEIADLARQAGKGDPRVDVALVWPCKGSPEYLPEIYRADRIESQLADAVRRAMDNPNVVKVDHERQTLFLAESIYRNRGRYIEIYEKRFCTEHATIVNALGMYADAKQRRRLSAAVAYRVAQIPFDWSLSEKEEPACSLDN